MTVPAPPKQDNRQRRHSTATMQIARRMYGNGSLWTPTQIRNYFAGQGVSVSLNTIRMWVIPGAAEEQRVLNLASYHRRRRGGPPTRTPLLDRMLELRTVGLPFSSIAAVITLDFRVPLNTEQARYYVQTGREPKRPKRRAAA